MNLELSRFLQSFEFSCVNMSLRRCTNLRTQMEHFHQKDGKGKLKKSL